MRVAPGVSFAADTAVTRVDGRTFAAEVIPGWDIAGNANGGYLLAIIARAVAEATGNPDPVTISAHYLAPGTPGPVTVDVDVVRSGGRHATATATLRDAEARPLIVTVATTTDLSRAEGPELVDADPPAMPGPEACVAMAPPDDPTASGDGGASGPPSFMHRVDLRLHPDDAWFARDQVSGKARVRGWFRLHDDEPLDTIGLLVALDGFPPTIFNASLPVGWTPTIELTAHLRARPPTGWLRCAFSTRFVTGGYLEEDGEVWGDDGRLIAQSRQLALVPRVSSLPAGS